MPKLIVIPTYCGSVGGTTVSLLMMVKGFEQLQAIPHLNILVQQGSLLESYMSDLGYAECLDTIPADTTLDFYDKALARVHQLPEHWPVMLENCISGRFFPILIKNLLRFRRSKRQAFLYFHDLGLSYHPIGTLMRKIAFGGLKPTVLCNSNYTASYVRQSLLGYVHAVLYQPIDLEKFVFLPKHTELVVQPLVPKTSTAQGPSVSTIETHQKPPIPENLQPILKTGAKVILTASRISEAHCANDKNLRIIPRVLAELKRKGQYFHGVVIGQDYSDGQCQSQILYDQAKEYGVEDRFTILPPTFDIQNYYYHADILLTLAPREPFGRTVIEAIACGLPVIGSNSGGIGEILSHFAREWMVDPQAPEIAAERIIHITEQSNTLPILLRGYQWLQETCSTQVYASQILKLMPFST